MEHTPLFCAVRAGKIPSREGTYKCHLSKPRPLWGGAQSWFQPKIHRWHNKLLYLFITCCFGWNWPDKLTKYGSSVIGEWMIFPVLAVLFLATLVRSAFGFGEALIAVPLLAFIIPVEVAAPVAVLVSITVAGIVVVQDWQEVHIRSAGWLILSSVLGIPLGLLLLVTVAEPIVKMILAAVILTFSTYSLMSRRNYDLKNDRWAWLFGFGAGVLGGAYGMNGPPLVIYGTLRGWSPRHFRATLQGYFLPASLVVMGGYWLTGLWTPSVSRYYFLSLPMVILAIFMGRFINRRMDARRFLIYIHVGLIIIGTVLLVLALDG